MSGEGDKGTGGEGGDKGGQGDKAVPKYDVAAVYSTLSDDNREFATRKGFIKADGTFADPNGWIDGYRGAERLLGGEKLSVPNLADEKARADWEGWGKLGTPADAKGYQFKRPEMPKGPDGQPVAYDEAAENGFRDLAAKLKMPQFMFDAIMTSEVGKRLQQAADQGTMLAGEKSRIETNLRKDFGAGYDASLQQAKSALAFMAKEAGVDAGKLADMASHEFGSEETARMFIKIAAMLGEDKLQGGHDNGFATGPAAARAELQRLDMDPEFQKAFTNADHAGHKQAIERRLNLLKTANS